MALLLLAQNGSDSLLNFLNLIAFIEFFIDNVINMYIYFLQLFQLLLKLQLQFLVFQPKILKLRHSIALALAFQISFPVHFTSLKIGPNLPYLVQSLMISFFLFVLKYTLDYDSIFIRKPSNIFLRSIKTLYIIYAYLSDAYKCLNSCCLIDFGKIYYLVNLRKIVACFLPYKSVMNSYIIHKKSDCLMIKLIDQSDNNFKLINNIMQQQKSQKSGEQALNLNYLPREPELREELKDAIERYRQRLEKKLLKQTQKDSQNMNLMQQLQNNIEKLDLRVKLIDDCSELSILRLDHLQQIFKHYCTHIFRTGAHMTFQRLQYQKVHMTMDRFFLFVKDFELAMMQTDNGKKEEVVEKPKIILMFKKISSTSKDLTFEQFIHCIEKLAVLYYNQKQVFYDKKEAAKQEKEKRKKQFEKKKQMRLAKKKKAGQDGQDNQQNDEENQEEQGNQGENQKQKEQKKEEEGEENDDLVKDMINDKDLEDPNEELHKISNRYAFQEEQEERTPLKPNRLDNINDQLLLIWSNEQKIQYYYQTKIKIDSVNDYRQKLTDLNLKIFQKGGRSNSVKVNTQTKHRKASLMEEQSRAEELKKKMQQKKLKQKASPIPKHKDDGAWAKAEEQKQRKRELKKQREQNAKKKSKQESDAVLQKKLDSQKLAKQKAVQKQSYNQNNVDWNMLGKISIDQLKYKQFNPHRYFNKDDDDKIFLDEYEGGRPRIMSGMEMRERNSIALVEDMKKRVNEVQKKQRKQQDNLSRKIGHNVPVKNRF